ncbi:MAG: S9 family peptidase [Flavobacteriaceae bacterium]
MTNKILNPPIAIKEEYKLENHGDVRMDPYFWMRLSDTQKEAEEKDSQTLKVLDYLERENEFFESQMAPTKSLQETLFSEIKSRIKEDDQSVPYFKNGYYYITRYEKGNQYPIYTRRKESLEAPEEIIFDVNQMAQGHDYYKIAGISISPDNRYAIFGEDTMSRRQYNLKLKDLETDSIVDLKISNTPGSAVWAADNSHFFFAQNDTVTLRTDKIFRQTIDLKTEPVLVFEETDETFNTFVSITKSRKYLVLGSFSTLSTEYAVLDTSDPLGDFHVIQARTKDLEYSIAHYEDNFYILTNKDSATNFKLMKTPVNKTGVENWVDVIPHREEVLLEDISIFKDFLVLEERENGLNQIRIKYWDGSRDFKLPFSEETYSAYVYANPEFDSSSIRYGYNSMTTPSSVIDFEVETGVKTILKEQEIPGGFNKEDYKSERLWVEARDGEKVALSIVHHKDTPINDKTPVLMYAYGSYGYTVDDGFSISRLSLLDRGFVFALAHIRGGEYLGRAWYENGKLLKKKNTFTDFIDCAQYLVDQKFSSPEHLYAMGGSAGGLLMGAISNMRPDLFNGIVAQVPFVDVVTTMLDESIPLTTGEYDEWGNPNDKEYYDYMKSYSPYDNVREENYPNMLITTGYFDSQVQYWEPAKWTAKLRDKNQSSSLILMHTDMDTGHSGASGRFDALKETARDFSFLLFLENELNK